MRAFLSACALVIGFAARGSAGSLSVAISTPSYPGIGTAVSLQPNFNWLAPSTVTIAALGAGTSYYLQASNNDPTFATLAVSITTPAVILSTNLAAGNGIYISTYTLASGTTYYWRVATIDPARNFGPWSTGSFVTDFAAPVGSSFASLNSTNGVIGEMSWNNLTAGVTAQVTVQDSVSGLIISTSAVAGGQPFASGGFGVLYSSDAGHTWVDGSWGGAAVPNAATEKQILSLAVYGGNLFAGTFPGAKVYAFNGASWSLSSNGIIGGESKVNALTVYNGNLYAAGGTTGKVAMYNGSSWSAADNGNQIISGENSIGALAVFSGKLYVAGGNTTGEVAVSDGSGWDITNGGAAVIGGESKMAALATYNGMLYAGGGTTGKVAVFNGTAWTTSNGGSAVIGGETAIRSMAVYNGKLYVGTGTNGKVASFDGTTWSVLNGNIPILLGETSISALTVFNGKLYVSGGLAGGAAVFDGVAWSTANAGYAIYPGETNMNALAAYNAKLYAGMGGGSAGQDVVIALTPVSAALSGSDGGLSAQTMSGTSLNVVVSTNSQICGGAAGCGATDQVKFTATDFAGNVLTYGPFTILEAAPPPTPTGLAVVAAGSTTASASWNPSAGAGSYTLQISSLPSFTAIAVTSVTAATSASAAGLVPNTTYYFMVNALSTFGQAPSAFSASVTTTTLPVSPGTPLFSNVLSSSFTVQWASGVPNGPFNGPATVYNVQVSTVGTFPPVFTSSQTGNLNATFTGLNGNQFYWVQLQALSLYGSSSSVFTAVISTRTAASIVSVSTVPTDVSTGVWENTASTVVFTASFGPGFAADYLYAWDNAPTHIWTGTEPTWTNNLSTQTLLADSTRYFHVAGQDVFGNIGQTADFGPYMYDPTPPAVSGFQSYNSAGLAVPEVQWNDLASGVTVQSTIQDISSGLNLNSGALPGTVGLWYLDEASGTVANDASGNGVNGHFTTFGSQPISWTQGWAGSGLLLAGAADSNLLAFQPNTINLANKPFTIEAWVFSTIYSGSFPGNDTPSRGAGNPIYSMWSNNAQDQGLMVSVWGGKPYFSFYNDDLIGNTFLGVAGTNWNHLAFVFNGSTQYIYVNGVFDSSRTVTGAFQGTGANGSYLGGCDPGSWCGTYVFSGTIDEVRITTAALTQTQIQYDANHGMASFYILYSTTTGNNWRRVANTNPNSGPYLAVSGGGRASAHTLTAYGLNLAVSTTSAGGASATNQVKVIVQDGIGNFVTSVPHAILVSNKKWVGGTGIWNVATNWSPSGVPTANDNLLIDQAATITADASAPISFKTLDLGNNNSPTLILSTGIASGGSLLIANGSALVSNMTSILAFSGNLSLSGTGSSITQTVSGKVNFSVGGNVTIASGTSITVDGLGGVGGQSGTSGGGSGGGLGGSFPTDTIGGGGGGGHGGVGGNGSNSTAGGGAYDAILTPASSGSGGGSGSMHNCAATTGGNGGGGITLVVGGTLTVNGLLSANGLSGVAGGCGNDSGGGSGGSINLNVATLSGNGIIRAGGGSGLTTGGGGGGGMISIVVTSSDTYTPTALSSVTALGGGGNSIGGAGAIFISNPLQTLLVLDNGSLAASAPTPVSGAAAFGVAAGTVAIHNAQMSLAPAANLNVSSITVAGQSAWWQGAGSSVTVPSFFLGAGSTMTMENGNTLYIVGSLSLSGTLNQANNASINLNVSSAATFNAGSVVSNSSITLAIGGNAAIGSSISASTIVMVVGGNLTLNPAASITGSTVTLVVGGGLVSNGGSLISADGAGSAGGAAQSSGQGIGSGAGAIGGANLGGGGGGFGGGGGTGAGNGGAGGASNGKLAVFTQMGSGGGGGVTSGSAGGAGGAGGGFIVLSVSGTMVLNGTLSANGVNGASANVPAGAGGGGAGGAIQINAGNLSGSGFVRTNGGNGGLVGAAVSGGGGGGGRISIGVSGTDSYTPTALSSVTAFGGSGAAVGGAGTVYVSNAGGIMLKVDEGASVASAATAIDTAAVAALTAGTMTISNAQISLASAANLIVSSFVVAGQTSWIQGSGSSVTIPTFNIPSGSTFNLTNANIVYVAGALAVGGTITHGAGGAVALNVSSSAVFNVGSQISGASMTINVGVNATLSGYVAVSSEAWNVIGSMTLNSGAAILASTFTAAVGGNMTVASGVSIRGDGQGYAGGALGSAGSGPGAGGGGSGGSTNGGGGGGHGGTGGGGSGSSAGGGGSNYDVTLNPVQMGSGGGGGDHTGCSGGVGGSGGGVLTMVVGGTLTVNGALSSNGGGASNGTCGGGGGGAGGSINLSAGNLAGNGTIQASGGNGSTPTGGGGGGGAIVILVSGSDGYTPTNLPNVTAPGGLGAGGGINGGAGTIYVSNQAGKTIKVDNLASAAGAPTFIGGAVVAGVSGGNVAINNAQWSLAGGINLNVSSLTVSGQSAWWQGGGSSVTVPSFVLASGSTMSMANANVLYVVGNLAAGGMLGNLGAAPVNVNVSGNAVFTNAGINATGTATINVGGGATFNGGASSMGGAALVVVGSSATINAGTLISASSLTFAAGGNLTLNAGASFIADAMGYSGGPSNVSGQGPGGGAGSNSGGGGGGHGGTGGAGSGGIGGPQEVDTPASPGLWGSGGGGGAGGCAGGGGGGLLNLNSGATLTLNGVVSANGGSGVCGANGGGGGGGGAVILSAGTIFGAGTIQANGGGGNSNGGGGGGGRIAINASTAELFAGTVSVSGGAGVNPGQPGSLFPAPLASISNHPHGQAPNAFTTGDSTYTLYAFQLNPGGAGSVSSVVFSLSGIVLLSSSNFSGVVIASDTLGNGQYAPGVDPIIGGAGVVSVSGSTGTITFSSPFAVGGVTNFVLASTAADMANTDAAIVSLAPGNVRIPTAGSSGTIYAPVSGFVSNSTHTYADGVAPGGIFDLAGSSGPTVSQITLRWSAPADNGAVGRLTLGSFKVQYTTSAADASAGLIWSTGSAQISIATTAVNVGSQQSAIAPGLISGGATYYFRIWAVDHAGNISPLSNGATIQTAPAPPPLAPASVQLAAVYPSSVTLQWAPQLITFATGYTILAAFDPALTSTAALVVANGQTSSSATVAGLTPNVTYYFTVRAENSYGSGPYAAALATSTLAGPPVTLGSASLTPLATQITVSWSSGTAAAGYNSANTAYVAQLSTSASFSPLASSAATGGLSLVFASLLPDTTYFVEVKAVNNNSVSSTFTFLGAVETQSVPPVLGTSEFTSLSTGSFSINWTSGPTVGGYIPAGTTYYIQLSTAPDFSALAASVATSGLSATFYGLNPDTVYYAEGASLSPGISTTAPVFGNMGSTSTWASAASVSAVGTNIFTGVWQNAQNIFVFSANFGVGNALYYLISWDAFPTHAFVGTETQWISGNSTQTAAVSGTYYFHASAVNGNGVFVSSVNFGPYQYDIALPAVSAFATINASGTQSSEIQWNSLTAGVTAQITAQDSLSGLIVSTSASTGLQLSAPGGFGILYSTTAGQSWSDGTWASLGAPIGGEAQAYAQTVYNNVLYAGTGPNGRIASFSGAAWAAADGGSSVIPGETQIRALQVYNGKLYASGGTTGKVAVFNGASWSLANGGSPIVAGETQVGALAVYNGKLYAGTGPNGKAAAFDGTSWSATNGGNSLAGAAVTSLAAYAGRLYAGVAANAEVTAFDGTSWTPTNSGSPIVAGENQINVLAVYNGQLYAGTGPNGKAARFNGSFWSTTNGGATVVAGETQIAALAPFRGRLYAGTCCGAKTSVFDGSNWTSVNANSALLPGGQQINSFAAFNGGLYAGAATASNAASVQLTAAAASLTGADGATVAETLSVTNLNLIQSASAVTCGGVSPCAATNQVRFAATDLAGNIGAAGPFAVLVDTTPPTVNLTSLAPNGLNLTATAAGVEPLSGIRDYNFQASSSSVFAFGISSSNFVSQSSFTFTGLQQGTTYYVRVAARNAVLGTSAYSTALSTLTLGSIYVSSAGIAPAIAQQNTAVGLLSVGIYAAAGQTGTFSGLSVHETGSASDSDVTSVVLYKDVRGNGVFDSQNDTILGNAAMSGGVATINLGASAQTITPATSTFFVAYQMSPQATVGNTVGAALFSAADMTVSYPYTAVGGLPMVSTASVIQDGPNLLTFSGTNLAPGTVFAGSSNLAILKLAAQTDVGTSILSTMTLHMGGTLASNQISAVKVYRDANANGVFDAGDTLLTSGNDVFVNGLSTLSFTASQANRTVGPVPTTLFVVANIANTAPPNSNFYVQLSTTADVRLFDTGDTIIFSTAPLTTSTMTIQNQNAISASLASTLPATLTQGASYAVILASLTVNGGSAQVNYVQVNRTGVGVDADVSAVSVWSDPFSDGDVFNPAVDVFLGSAAFASGTAGITISTVTLTAGATTPLLIVYAISPSATPGDTLGATMTNATFLRSPQAFTAISGNFPFSTSTGTVAATQNHLLITSYDQSPGTLLQGATSRALLRLDVRSDLNSILWSGVRVGRLGSGTDGDVAHVEIFRDSDGNGTLDAADAIVTSGQDAFVGGTANVAFLSPQTIGASTQTFFVAVDVSTLAVPSDTIGVFIGSAAYFNLSPPNLVAASVPFPIQTAPAPVQQYPNVVSLSTASITPVLAINPGTANIGLMKLSLQTNVSQAAWLQLHLDRTGVSSDADVSAVKIYYDINQLGVFNPNNLGQYQLVSATGAAFGNAGFGSVTLTLSPAMTLSSTPKAFFVAVDLATGAAPGDTIGIRAVNVSYVSVAAPNTVGNVSFASSLLTVNSPPTLMAVAAASSAPARAVQGSINVPMAVLHLSMPQYTGYWQGLLVARTGNGLDSDISRIKLYVDSNANGILDPLTDVLVATGTFNGGLSALTFFSPQAIGAATATYFLAYDFSSVALPGDNAGLALTGPGVFTLASPNGAANVGFPFQTGSSTVTATQAGVSASGLDRAPASVAQGATAQVLLSLTMNTTFNAVLWNTLFLTRTGNAQDSDVTGIHIFYDANFNGLLAPNDPEVTGGADHFVNGAATITLNVPQTIGTVPSQYLIALDISLFATVGSSVGVIVSSAGAIGVSAPNYVVGAGFPVASTPAPIAKRPDILTASWSDLTPPGAIQGSAAPMAKVTMRAQRDRVIWTQLSVAKTGTLADGFVDQVRIYRDVLGTGVFNSTDPLVGTGVFSAGAAAITLSSPQTVTTSTQTYFVNFAYDPGAPIGATAGLSVAAASNLSVSAPDAVSASGLPFSTTQTILLDARTPTQPVVTLDGPFSGSFDTVHFLWTSTLASGTIAGAAYSLGTTPGGTDVAGYAAIPNIATNFTAQGLALRNGATYYVSVKAQSSFGFVSQVGVSLPVLVDITVPSVPIVTMNVGASAIQLTWMPSQAGPSGLAGYLVEYRMGTSPVWYNAKTNAISAHAAALSSDRVFAVSTSSANLVNGPGITFTPPGGTVLVRVSAVSGAGVVSPATSVMEALVGPLTAGGISGVSNYPNPFDSRTGQTTINYTLSGNSDVAVTIFNLFGGRVREFHLSSGGPGGAAGSNDVVWDGTDSSGRKVSKGIYLAILQGGGAKVTQKIGVIH